MQYNTTPAQQQPQGQQNAMDLSSLIGVSIGQDVTGKFALTPSGLAVLGRDGRYFGMDIHDGGGVVLDLTSMVLPINAAVYRIPSEEVFPGDLIVISDAPFRTLFVLEVPGDGTVVGLDPGCNELVTYFPPENPFADILFGGHNIFARVVSMFDVLNGVIGDFGELRR
jgi:hypothetical protein